MNVGSLFSGIGGLDHGLARAGFRHAFLCESDPWRREVLAHHFPGVPIYEDVASVGRAELSRRGGVDGQFAGRGHEASEPELPDLLCGGFPCQDVSVAGRRAGLAGERSGLFYEFARIAESLRPRWLLVENVPGLLSSNGGRDFGAVIGTLADIGYGVAWRILDSRYFGVPQRRRRVFVLGTLAVGDPRGAAERAGEILAVGTRCKGHFAENEESRKDLARALTSGSHPNSNAPGRRKEDDVNLVARPLGGGNDGVGRRSEDDPNLVTQPQTFDWQMDGGNDKSWGGKARSWIHDKPGRTRSLSRTKTLALYQPEHVVRRLTPTECERLQALPDGWTDFGPDSRRYAALGDAVTASVSEWIGRRLVAA